MIRIPGGLTAAVTIGLIAMLAATTAIAAPQACEPGLGVCPATSAPEPATLCLLALGVAGIAIARRRK